MIRKSDLQILTDELMGYLQDHIDNYGIDSPYTLTPAEVRTVLENNKLQNDRIAGCEEMMISISKQLKSAGDSAKRESDLSVGYVKAIELLKADNDNLKDTIAKKDRALVLAGKHMEQQSSRLAGSSGRAVRLAKELKGYKEQVKELRSELYDIEIDRDHGQEPEKTEIQKHDEAVRYKKQQAIRQAGKLYGEVKFDEERAMEQAADLYIKRIVELFSMQDAKIIRNSLLHSSEPGYAPIGQSYIMLVANLASYANITPNDIEVAHSKTNLANFLKEKPAWPTQTD